MSSIAVDNRGQCVWLSNVKLSWTVVLWKWRKNCKHFYWNCFSILKSFYKMQVCSGAFFKLKRFFLFSGTNIKLNSEARIWTDMNLFKWLHCRRQQMNCENISKFLTMENNFYKFDFSLVGFNFVISHFTRSMHFLNVSISFTRSLQFISKYNQIQYLLSYISSDSIRLR